MVARASPDIPALPKDELYHWLISIAAPIPNLGRRRGRWQNRRCITGGCPSGATMEAIAGGTLWTYCSRTGIHTCTLSVPPIEVPSTYVQTRVYALAFLS